MILGNSENTWTLERAQTWHNLNLTALRIIGTASVSAPARGSRTQSQSEWLTGREKSEVWTPVPREPQRCYTDKEALPGIAVQLGRAKKAGWQCARKASKPIQ